MPATSLEIIHETGMDLDHSKQKRNRMRISCINCYASKRKCDRKRPCSRCKAHGLAGLCAYDIDDPSSRDKRQTGQVAYLKRRIAQLESMLRQVKDKPHPRWTLPGGTVHDPEFTEARKRSHRRPQKRRRTFTEGSPDAPGESDRDAESKGVESSPSFSEYATSDSTSVDDRSCSPCEHVGHALDQAAVPHEGPEVSEDVDSPPSNSITHVERAASHPSEDTPISTNPTGGRATTRTSVQNYAIAPQCTSNAQTTNPHPPENTQYMCRCISTSSLFNPLFHFAMALRISHDALKDFHADAPNCELFRRIVELDYYIFSATPAASQGTDNLWSFPSSDELLQSPTI